MNQHLNGRVVKEQSGFFWVEIDDGTIYRCQLRGRLLEEAQSSDIAAIGDRVQIVIVDETEYTGTIEEVAERETVLSRAVRTSGNRGAGQAEREQVIIANVDQAFMVFAAAHPAPDLKMLDRFLVAGEKAEIEHLTIVVNKIDLEDPSRVQARFTPYAKMGYSILYTSALHGHGIDDLRRHLTGHLSVFSGPSGVGKTSLLNRIQPGLGRAVKAVSQTSAEGVHTTRDSELIKLDDKTYIADTPGIRTLTVWDVEPEELDGYYIDISPHVEACHFSNCTHTEEPKCAVREAVEKGEINRERYKSYRTLRDELEAAYALY